MVTFAFLLCFVSCNQGETQNPEHIHKFGEWSVTKNPTCTEGGEKVCYCDCGEKLSEIIASTSHKEQIIPAKDATCTEKGLTEGKMCSACGEILVAQQQTPMTAHIEEILPAVEATCTEKGLTEGKKCSVCEEMLASQQETPLKAHTEELVPAVAATCNQTGLTEGKRCSVCLVTLVAQQTVSKTAHTYTDKNDESCNKCGFIRDVACVHTQTEVIKGKEATCTSAGLTDGEKCKQCGEILVQQTVIKAKDHTEVIDAAVEPTCTSTGLTEGKHCSVCGTTIVAQVGVPMLEHSYLPTVTAPTCTKVGYTTYTCKCGEFYIDDYTEKGDHTFGEWIVVREATETEEGLRERYCVCSAKESETIPVKSLYVRDGNYIYFGEYPQTIKANDVTITDTTDDRGYYLGSDGNYYAMVVANKPGTFSTGSTFTLGNTYYFKVEPIRWKILYESDGTALILCDIAISSIDYQPDYFYSWSDDRRYTTANGAPEGTFANNYKYSNVRKWLIDEFYNTAFSELQQEIIEITEVDNSDSSYNVAWGYGINEPTDDFACENTYDKIFLLSASEVINSDYGFTTNASGKPRIFTSDYARAMGSQCSSGGFADRWILRSPGNISSLVRYIASHGGMTSGGVEVDSGFSCIIPALRITL